MKFKILSSEKFDYMMLSRLIQDAKYFINYPELKHLWTHDLNKHIEEMKKQYNKLDPKPEWTSLNEIEDLAKQMKESYKNYWNERHTDNKIEAAEQPTTPKPTTTLPDNMTWAWDPKANQWIAVMKDNPVVTPPTYNPNNITNTSNYTTTTYTPIKSTLIDSLNQFLDGDKYSREIKIEKGLISDGLIKLAGINPIKGPKYSITDKGLNLLKQAAQEEYDFEKDYINARKSYLLDGITESEFKTGSPQSQGQMPKFSIFEKDGSELAQIEASNETDAKVKFIMENPEYEGSQTISVKKVKSSINVDEAKKWLEKTYPMLNRLEKGSDLYNELKEQIDYVENLIYSNKKDAKYSETTTQGLDFPNKPVSPSTDVIVDTKGWVNVQSAKLTPQLLSLGGLLEPYIKNGSVGLSIEDENKGNISVRGDAKTINTIESKVRDLGIFCNNETLPVDEGKGIYTLNIFLEK